MVGEICKNLKTFEFLVVEFSSNDVQQLKKLTGLERIVLSNCTFTLDENTDILPLLQLKKLSLAEMDAHYLEKILSYTFPLLEHFEWEMVSNVGDPHDDLISKFFRNHPNLKSISTGQIFGNKSCDEIGKLVQLEKFGLNIISRMELNRNFIMS